MTAGQPYTYGLTSSRDGPALTLPEIATFESKQTLSYREQGGQDSYRKPSVGRYT